MNPNNNKWCLSTNNEEYDYDFFDTSEEAIAYANSCDDYDECETMFVGKAEYYEPYVDAHNILEDIEDAVYSEHIDYAYDYLDDVTEEHITKLQKQLQITFNNWAKEHNYETNFFAVNEYYAFTRTQKEDDMKLKPCPFCGKEVKLHHVGTHGYDLHVAIGCCITLRSDGLIGIPHLDEPKEQELIAKWNRRMTN